MAVPKVIHDQEIKGGRFRPRNCNPGIKSMAANAPAMNDKPPAKIICPTVGHSRVIEGGGHAEKTEKTIAVIAIRGHCWPSKYRNFPQNSVMPVATPSAVPVNVLIKDPPESVPNRLW